MPAKKVWTPEQRRRVERMLANGYTAPEVGRILGKSTEAIRCIGRQCFPVFVSDPEDDTDRLILRCVSRDQAERIVRELNAEALRHARRPAPLYYCGNGLAFTGWEVAESLLASAKPNQRNDHDTQG